MRNLIHSKRITRRRRLGPSMGVKGVGLIALLIALGFLLLSTVSTRATGSRSHRFVEVSGIRVAGSLATRVDIFLDIAPGQDQAALEEDALARAGAQPLRGLSPEFVFSGFKWPQS